MAFGVILAAALLASPCPVSATTLHRDTWYLPTDDGKAQIFVEEIGPPTAAPVVVLHGGWGAEHSYLDAVVAPQAGPAHRFVLYDQRGSLLSAVQDPKSLSLGQQLADLEQLRKALGVPRLTLFAHSMGTYLAMAYTQAYPDHVAGLILTGTLPAKTPEGGAEAYWAMSNAAGRALLHRPAVKREIALLESERDPIAARKATHLWRINFAAVNMVHVEHWRDMPGGKSFFNQAAASAITATMPQAWNFEPALLSGRYTVSLINGDHDYADYGEHYWRGVAARNPVIHLLVLHDAGHSAWLDDPNAFQKALRAALSR